MAIRKHSNTPTRAAEPLTTPASCQFRTIKSGTIRPRGLPKSKYQHPSYRRRNIPPWFRHPRQDRRITTLHFSRYPGEDGWDKFSPTAALCHYLYAIAGHEKNLEDVLPLFSGKPDCLPALTARVMLRQRLARGELTALEREVVSSVDDNPIWAFWKQKWALRGVGAGVVRHWVWILSAETADLAIERLIATQCWHPPFLLNILVGRDRTIKKPKNFVALLRYVHKYHIGVARPQQRRSSFDLPWEHFLRLLRRLIQQCLISWPTLLPSVARLAAVYIERGPLRQRTGLGPSQYTIQCKVFNQCLTRLSLPPARHPLNNMIHNWEAQKVLLDLSSRLQHTLVINRESYLAMGRVLVALPKTVPERKIAERASKTWPPFRRDFDGRDEQRQPEDDLSLAAKVGILRREAGYPDDHMSRALDVLAGSVVGQAPTTQTRSLLPPTLRDPLAIKNIDTEWASRIKATRNAREAWRMFLSPPMSGLKPGTQVYAEMFEKLAVDEVSDASRVLPGDGKEVFPVYNGNLSALEIARISPPSFEELYLEMRRSGIKPTKLLLVVLLRYASSKEAALQYLADSPDNRYVQLLRETVFEGLECSKLLATLPRRVFYAWTEMLCVSQVQRRNNGDYFASRQIQEAMCLAAEYQRVNSKAPIDMAPWYIIMKHLAARGIIYSEDGAKFNMHDTLSVFMRHWQRMVDRKGPDNRLFELLCAMVRKSLRLATWRSTSAMSPHVYLEDRDGSFARLLLHACLKLRETFEELIQPIHEYDGSAESGELLTLPYRITSKHVSLYMRALGTLGDAQAMVRLMWWILDAWDCGYILSDARHPQELAYDRLIQTFAYFSRIGKHIVDASVMRELQEQLEKLRCEKSCTWFWPVEESDTYDDEIDLDLGAADRWSHVRDMIYHNKGDFALARGRTPGCDDNTQQPQLTEAEIW